MTKESIGASLAGSHISVDTTTERVNEATLFGRSFFDIEGGSLIGKTVQRRKTMEIYLEFVRNLQVLMNKLGEDFKMNSPKLEIILKDLSFKAPSSDIGLGKNNIQTIYNTNPLYEIQKFIQCMKKDKEDQAVKKQLAINVLSNISLILKPKKRTWFWVCRCWVKNPY